jgi:hypothetical protein
MRSSVETIRKHIEALRLALLAPSSEGIEQCLPLLADAAGSLISIQRELGLPGSDSDLGRELKALKKDLVAVQKLIEHGAAFWNQWAKLLGALSGYTPSGEARPVAAAGAISIRG